MAKHFVALDKAAKGGFRAARDILFRDYVELVVARVLGPERVLWFLRECLVRGGTEYFQASGRHSIIAKTAEERRRKEGHDSVRMWDKLWAGWKPALPMEPNAIQLRGPDKKEARGVSSEAGGKAREPLSPEAGVQGGGGRGAREEAGEKEVEEGSTVPVSDTEAVDRDVLTMAAEAARQELHPEPPSTALYGKQTWDLPSAATGKGKKKKKKKKDEL